MDAFDYVFGAAAPVRRSFMNVGNVWYKHAGTVGEGERREKVIERIDWMRREVEFSDGVSVPFATLYRDFVCRFDDVTAEPIRHKIGAMIIKRGTPIAEVDYKLSNRAINVLGRMGINTIGELDDVGFVKCRKARGSGARTVGELAKLLASVGANVDGWKMR